MQKLEYGNDEIEVYGSLVNSIRGMMEEYAAMMDEHRYTQWCKDQKTLNKLDTTLEETYKSAWTWGICTLSHPERTNNIMSFEFGGEEDLPPMIKNNLMAERFIVVTEG